jgi:hypothetical protein
VAYLAEIELHRRLGTIPAGRRRGLVRVSRGGGLPRFLPDIGGLAVRLCDVGGPGRHQDLLLSSSARPPILRHVLVPTYAVDSAWFSSLVPFDDGERVVLFGGRRRASDGLGPVRYELLVAEREGPWEGLGEVVLGRRLDDDEAEALTTSPWNDAGGVRPVGLLNALRDRAYRASQAGRGQAPSARS